MLGEIFSMKQFKKLMFDETKVANYLFTFEIYEFLKVKSPFSIKNPNVFKLTIYKESNKKVLKIDENSYSMSKSIFKNKF